MKEQPIMDTTPKKKIEAGMWCEFRDVNTDADCCGVLEADSEECLLLDGETVFYSDGTTSYRVKNLRVYEHKPQTEYPTEEGFYGFGGSIYIMRHGQNGNVWTPIYGVHTGILVPDGVGSCTDGVMRYLYPDVAPTPYKLVPEGQE